MDNDAIEKNLAESLNDPVNHPKHYNSHPSGVECIQVTEHMNFNIGNAVKYLWRYEGKNGLQDLKKAAWYVNREIERQQKLQQEADTAKRCFVSDASWKVNKDRLAAIDAQCLGPTAVSGLTLSDKLQAGACAGHKEPMNSNYED